MVSEIEQKMAAMVTDDYEIILVNDCSADHTRDVIFRLAETNRHVIALSLAKNAGQDSACLAGFHRSTGDYVISLDDDGQNPVNEIDKMLVKLEEGYDVVIASYPEKKHSRFRNFGSRLNDYMEIQLLGKPKDLYIGSFFAARRFVIDQIIQYTNPYPYIRGLLLSATSNITNVPVTHRERISGTSQYTLKKLIRLMANGFTSFSVKPLRIATLMGAVIAVSGFAMMLYSIVQKIVNPGLAPGWASLMAVITFLGGAILLTLGMIGEYIGRIYISLNRIPQFVIKEDSQKHGANKRDR